MTASNGTLILNGSVDGVALKIATTAPSDLFIAGTATTGAIAINNANQTLEIGGYGHLTINAAESVTNGTIKLDAPVALDAAVLTDNFGIKLGSGATLTGAGVVDAGVDGGATAGGTVIATGGTLEIDGQVDQSGKANTFDIESGSTLKFDEAVGTASITPTIDFQGSGAKLDLTTEGRGAFGEMALFKGEVSGLAAGNQILVGGAAGDTVTNDGGVLTVENSHGTIEEQIALGPDDAGATFGISTSFGVDTITTLTICFMAGTLVRTPAGEVAVETLKRGDLVVTSDGRSVPVTWLGRQSVSMRFADPLRVLPIRVKAGALGDNVPSRDLLLSPDHAVLVDGALIQAGALVNGTSIVRETRVPQVFTYYHVEADDHSLILAENTPAETFVDNVDRLNFDNWAEHQALYPDGKPIAELPYPRAKAHRQVPVNIRVKLAERAQAIGAAVAGAAVA